MNWRKRIVVDPEVLLGKPIIKGTRISVEFVIDLLARGRTAEQILKEYDHLAIEDVQACLAYAGDLIRKEKSDSLAAHNSRVTVEPAVCGGRPCIRDTRIEIAVILDGLAEGLTFEEIIDHYPQLTREDILAALAYAADSAHEICGTAQPRLES